MAKIYPWGDASWLFSMMPKRKWTVIASSSFEERCTAFPLWGEKNGLLDSLHLMKINDPPEGEHAKECDKEATKFQKEITKNTAASTNLIELDLISQPGDFDQIIRKILKQGISIVVDISTMPKRQYLFLVSRILASKQVKDLVVCYTKPAAYKEGLLSDNFSQPSSLPGHGCDNPVRNKTTVIVGVGYVGINLSEILEQANGEHLKFLFPFPPASPAFRRNWNLLHKLNPEIPIQSEIKRIHSMDMFSALNWLREVISNTDYHYDLIPLGPKPHSLAMSLAYRHHKDRTSLIYPQPQSYHPGYSTGIAIKNGDHDITAYCLRHNYKDQC